MSFNPDVSIVSSIAKGALVIEDRPIRDILDQIKNGSDETDKVTKVRSAVDEVSRKQCKLQLLAFTGSGVFQKGMTTRGQQPNPHSELVQLDFDYKNNKAAFESNEMREAHKRDLFMEEHVFTAFISTSETGIKLFCRVLPHQHKMAFTALCDWAYACFGLVADRSTCHVNALCYISSDPKLLVKDEVVPFQVCVKTADNLDKENIDSVLRIEGPVPGWDVKDVEELLQYIEPDEYDKWLTTGMAIKHQFPDERGFELWDKWSQRTKSNNYDHDECRTKWERCFLDEPKSGKAARTLRSLMYDAKAAGWSPAGHAIVQMVRLEAWIDDHARTLEELTTTSIKRIADICYLSRSDREILLEKICDHLAARRAKVSKSYLRGKLQIAVAERRKLFPDVPPKWAYRMVYIGGRVNLFIDEFGGFHTPDAIDHMYGKDMPPWAEQNPHQYLLDACQIPRAADFTYSPGLPPGEIITILPPDPCAGSRAFNTYRASYSPALDNDIPEQKALIDEFAFLYERHLENLIMEIQFRRVVLDFQAFIVQYPGRKIRWALFLQGAQGSGKGTLIFIMRVALGPGNVRDIDGSSALESEFNSFATGHQLVGLNEITNTGERHHRIYNKLKQLITEDTVERNEKFQPRAEVGNVTNYILTANAPDALPFDEDGDRRYFVVMSRLQNRSNVLERMVPAHCKELRAFAERNPGAVRAYFLRWKISSEFDPNGHAPLTPYLKTMAREAQTSLKREVREAIEESEYPLVQGDLLSLSHLAELLPEVLRKTPPTRIASILRELGYVSIGRVRIGKDGERFALWVPGGSPLADDVNREALKALLKERVLSLGGAESLL